MMVWKDAISPTTATAARILAMSAPKSVAEAVEQRLAGLARAQTSPGAIAGIQEQHEERRDDQRQDAGDDALRHVALRIVRFFGRERQLLDREEEPHREGQSREDARIPEWQPRAAAVWRVRSLPPALRRR